MSKNASSEAAPEGAIQRLEQRAAILSLAETIDVNKDDLRIFILDYAKQAAEIEALRSIVSKCCNALPNGAYCAADASLEFMGRVPDEVLLVTADLILKQSAAEARAVELERELERVRAAFDRRGEAFFDLSEEAARLRTALQDIADSAGEAPCGGEHCYCGNTDDAEREAEWRERNAIAALARAALKEKP